jgi:hypothetical protein
VNERLPDEASLDNFVMNCGTAVAAAAAAAAAAVAAVAVDAVSGTKLTLHSDARQMRCSANARCVNAEICFVG